MAWKRLSAEEINSKLREGVRRYRRGSLAGPDRGDGALHREDQSLGKWLQRALQRQAPGRANERGTVLLAAEAKVLIDTCRRNYLTKRPHSRLGYHPPAPQTHGSIS